MGRIVSTAGIILVFGACGGLPEHEDAAETTDEATESLAAPADAPRTETLDCKSAVPPKQDFSAFIETCRAQAAARRASSPSARAQPSGTAAADGTVFDSRTTVAGLDFTNVPTWSDADILDYFASTRDSRYMTQSFPPEPGFQRRISWLYPDDGCYARAEQVNVQVAEAGKSRPYKLFAFGQTPLLRVYTENNPEGMVSWWYHVVPVIKNSAGEPIVLDSAVSPCKPLPYKTWLASLVDDMTTYDDLAAGNGVSLGDSWAYVPFSSKTGEPSHSEESLNALTGLFLYSEWTRQEQLGRDPNVVLGTSPPWSGYACVGTEQHAQTALVAPGSSATLTAACPFATLAVGGGLDLGTPTVAVSKNAKSGNGWQVTARNTGSSSTQLTASAVCLTGAPANATVTTVAGDPVNVAPNAFNTSNASCASGALVGGGYLTTLGSGSGSVMRVYANGRTTSTSSTWQASAFNTTSSAKSITAYAYCLANSSFTVSQTSANLSGSSIAFATCAEPGKTLGGGFVFPRTSPYNVMKMQNWDGLAYVLNMLPAPPDGDPNAKGHAQCLAHP